MSEAGGGASGAGVGASASAAGVGARASAAGVGARASWRDALPGLLVGSYTATGGGTATGISFVQDGVATTVAVMDDPSFLAVSGDRVYAVSEVVDGSVHAFRRQGNALEHLWTAAAGGDAPCHVRVDAGGVLVLTNYTSGTVTAVSLASASGSAGRASATAVLPDVTGPDADRQDGPHAHQSVATPEGTILVADLGGDALHEFSVSVGDGAGAGGSGSGSVSSSSSSSSLALSSVRVHHVAPGAGPRHMAWFDGDLFVAGELDGRVYRLRRDESGSFRTVASVSTGAGESLLSHIEVDDAGHVYVAVRGRDVIVVLDAADGALSVMGSASSGGVWPRHFARVPGFVLVANERSDAIAVLPVEADGVPGEPVGQIAVGTPTCVVPLS